MELQLIKNDLLSAYLEQASPIQAKFDALKDAEISTDSFSFYTSVASVFSSKIEGENIELDSYIKHKGMGIAFEPDYTKKIDDLYNAYIFAQNNTLSIENISKAHKLLSKNIVRKDYQGKFRTQNMYVASDDGRIEYVAASPFTLNAEMGKFYQDVDMLLEKELSYEEVFYYAAYIHLIFVKIHPWNDGNGRSGRLIEKWFIAQKLGEKAWFLQSEKNYYLNHQLYYQNLRKPGLEYETLDYSKALPFLLMLPNSLALS
jgi:Fic family protein